MCVLRVDENLHFSDPRVILLMRSLVVMRCFLCVNKCTRKFHKVCETSKKCIKIGYKNVKISFESMILIRNVTVEKRTDCVLKFND